MSKKLSKFIPAGHQLTFSSDAITSGTYRRLADPGATGNAPISFSASSSVSIGPFNDPYEYEFIYNGTDLSVSVSSNIVIEGVTASAAELNYVDGVTSSLQTQMDLKQPIIPASNAGTAATNVVAAEYGNDFNKTTVLTVINAVLPAITGGGNEALGVLLYTLPAGAVVVKSAYMSLAIQQQDENITADTPDGGLGTLQASDAQATLDADDAACENIITGQTFNDCDGTAEVKTVADQILVIESAGDHTVYFNVAASWSASGDTGPLVSGTVVLNWQFIV